MCNRMSLFDEIKAAFSSSGPIDKIDKVFEEKGLNPLMGIKMHHAGIDGIDEDRIVIREYKNGTTGDVIMTVEWDGLNENWELKGPPRNRDTIATVSGKENYEGIAHQIESYIQETY